MILYTQIIIVMILDCVLTSVNENELYLDFIPFFIDMWKKLYPSVNVKIVLIAESIPDSFSCYKDNIILFPPIPNVPTAFTSQFIRLLYPCILNYENGIMITDIDDVPLNNTYFTENIKDISNDKWINLRDWTGKGNNQIAMCWQIATSKTWTEVFNIHNLDDVKKTLIDYGKNGARYGWGTDQHVLYKNVMTWHDKTKNYIFLKDKETGFNRITRNRVGLKDKTVIENIKKGFYSDYHCHRPMKDYYELNYGILKLCSSI